MEKMLGIASRNLGVTPESLKEMLGKGDLNAIMAKMKPEEAEKLKSAMNNPDVKKNLMDSPEMAQYMNHMKDS